MLEPCLSKAQIIINVTTHLTTNHTMVTITKYSHRLSISTSSSTNIESNYDGWEHITRGGNVLDMS